MRARTFAARRRSMSATIGMLVLGVVAGFILPLSPLPLATEAQAAVARGGASTHGPAIEWIEWNPARAIANGSYTHAVVAAGQQITVTCTLSGLTASEALVPYRPTAWSKAGFNQLYWSSTTAPGNDRLVGLANAADRGSATFDVSCVAMRGEQNLPLGGLVFADAEQSRNDEYVAATAPAGSTWRILDTYRDGGCTQATRVIQPAAVEGRLELRGAVANADCNAGPTVVALAQGASRLADVAVVGGGKSAIALGVILPMDFGDAPESYGHAAAAFQPGWIGGEVVRRSWSCTLIIICGWEDGLTSVFGPSYVLASQTAPALRLGTHIDADSAYPAGSLGTADDLAGAPDDEDATFGFTDATSRTVTGQRTVDLYASPLSQQSISVSCIGPTAVQQRAAVQGWIDFNGDGVFSAGEASASGVCELPSGGTQMRATLTWTIPTDVVPATDASSTYLRVRIANAGTSLTPTGFTTSGEVEDHPIRLAAPQIRLEKTSDLSAGTVGTAAQNVRYDITLTNSGRLPLSAPTITDNLTDVLNGATYVENSAAASASGTLSGPTGNQLRWVGSGQLSPGASVVLSLQVRLNEARRGQKLVNQASATAISGAHMLTANALVETPVAVAVTLEKHWVLNGGPVLDHEDRPAGFEAAAEITGTDGALEDVTWSELRDGYSPGVSVTVTETTTTFGGASCRLDDVSVSVEGREEPQPTSQPIALTRGHTTITVTNYVTCDTTLTLVNHVEGDAGPLSWALTATPVGGAALSFESGTARQVSPGTFELASRGGADTYIPSDWDCLLVSRDDAPGESIESGNALVVVPLGQHVRCEVTQRTARITLLKVISTEQFPGGLDASWFTMRATPAQHPELDLHVFEANGAGDVETNTFEARPEHTYSLSERSDYAYLQLAVQRQMPDGTWVGIDREAIQAPAAGSHDVYRFVNAAPPALVLPLTGGIGSDTYVIGGGALLLLALALMIFRSRRSAQREPGLPESPTVKPPSISLLSARIQKGTAAMATIKKSRAARIAAGLGAAAIATVTILGGALPASAAPNIDTNRQGSIVIHKYEQPATTLPTSTGSPLSAADLAGQTPINGVLFQVRQIGTFDVRDNADWAGLPAMSARDIVANPDNYSLGDARQLTTATHATLGAGVAQFGSLPLGAYIVQELGLPTVTNGSSNVVIPGEPFIVAVPQAENNTWQYDVHVYPKNSVIGASKEVSGYAPQGLGSKLTWTIRSSAPIASQNTSLTSYAIEDALDPTLDYVEGSATVSVAGTALASTAFSVTAPATAGGTVTVTFEGAGVSALRANPGAAVVVTIDTTVVAMTSNGKVANTGRVVVNGNGVVTSNQVVENWGGIEILKTDATAPATPLQGAVFSVYATTDTGFANPLAINGVTEFTSGADGIVTIHGLRTNVDGSAQYVVREERAPSGFQIGSTSSWTVDVPVGTNEDIELTVTNAQVPAYTLPITGGAGQAAFMIGGAGLILGGLGFVLLRRRKTQAENQA
ncbi:SpaH/EbpB family LPXTG-anchored major pilin [Agrococcus lahaulensis]|uniref:SpaH/EbpB family LPXTG-anchored major pilin n=1 Tax=Agrococcus lahaulensis TaxID=341722 RepID=UPI0004244B06|nr:SpaH/EbpB family LPXTG-anchored major pilin [Agrococcus lahaulensis]